MRVMPMSRACSGVRQTSCTVAPERASSVATAVPQLPAPTTTGWRIGCRPPSHSHCSEMHDHTRLEISCASDWRGSRSSGRGKVRARPQRTVTRPGPDQPPAAQALGPEDRDRHDRGARLEHEPADTALRLAERARAHAGALGEDADDTAALQDHPRGLHRLLVRLAAPDGERAERQQEPGLPALVEQLDLRDEVQRPAEAAADHERVGEAAVVRGHQHRARPWARARARSAAAGSRDGRTAAGSRAPPSRRASRARARGRSGGRAGGPRCSKEVPRPSRGGYRTFAESGRHPAALAA